MSPAADDLDALLASLLAPVPEQVPVVEPVPLVGQSLPKLPEEDVELFFAFRGWREDGAPGGIWQPPSLDPPPPEFEELEPEILLELAAAQAGQSGDQKAFDKALARLPPDRAEHHRRMAAMCALMRARQDARTSTSPSPGGRS